jgi:hypothetical protein
VSGAVPEIRRDGRREILPMAQDRPGEGVEGLRPPLHGKRALLQEGPALPVQVPLQAFLDRVRDDIVHGLGS